MSDDNVRQIKSLDYSIVTDLMFQEYNAVAEDFDLPPMWSRSELLKILEDNIQSKQIKDLKANRDARLALAGHITAIMMEIDIFVAMNSDDGTERPDGQDH